MKKVTLFLCIVFFFGMSGGQDISLKEYIDQNIASLKELIESKFELAQIAVNKAEEAQHLRNEQQNEWRGQSKDREAAFALKTDVLLLRTELTGRVNANSDDINKLKENQANLAGKASQNTVNVAVTFSIISTLISVILLYKEYRK